MAHAGDEGSEARPFVHEPAYFDPDIERWLPGLGSCT